MGLFSANPQPLSEQNLSHTATAPGYKSGNGRRHQPKLAKETATGGCFAGSPLYSTVRPRQFIGVPLKRPPEKPARAKARTTQIAGHHRKRHLSRDAACGRNRIHHGLWATGATPQPPDLSIGPLASQPFRCGFLDCSADCRRLQAVQEVPGTTRNTPTGRDCLAADTARTGAWSKPCPGPASTQAPLPDFSV